MTQAWMQDGGDAPRSCCTWVLSFQHHRISFIPTGNSLPAPDTPSSPIKTTGVCCSWNWIHFQNSFSKVSHFKSASSPSFRAATFPGGAPQVNLTETLWPYQKTIDKYTLQVRSDSLSVTCHRSPSSMYVKMVPGIVPTKRVLSSFTADKFNSRYIFRDRNSLRVSEHYSVPEDSSTSQADTTKTKQQNMEQEEDSSGIICTCITLIYETEIILKIFFCGGKCAWERRLCLTKQNIVFFITVS